MDDDKQIEIIYEPDYTIEDNAFAAPFVVMKQADGGRTAWWNGLVGKTKVLSLISSFKVRMTTEQAQIAAGITTRQYEYFCKRHPLFVPLKARLKQVLTMGIKQRLVGDLAHPNNFAARRWWLEQAEPETYGKGVGANVVPPQIAPVQTTPQDGKIIVSKQTAEALKRLNDNGNSGSGSKPEGKTG